MVTRRRQKKGLPAHAKQGIDTEITATGDHADHDWDENPQAPDDDDGFERDENPQAPDDDDGFEWEENPQAPGANEVLAPRGKPFQKGVSGNPAGRPKGSRNHTTRIVELVEQCAEVVLPKAQEDALNGDTDITKALISLFRKTLPADRGKALQLNLQVPASFKEVPATMRQILQRVFDGYITPEEGERAIELFKLAVNTSLRYRRP